MLDAIIISDSGAGSYSASSPLRLQIDGQVAFIQYIRNYLENGGRIAPPVIGENEKSWRTAPKLNGIRLLSCLQREGYRLGLVDSYYQQRDQFSDLLEENPKAIVISTTFIFRKADLRELVDDIRLIAPNVHIIAGGPFVLSSYLLRLRSSDRGYDVLSPREDFLFLSDDNSPDIDLYIIDKGGEQILSEALKRIGDGLPLDDLPNTAQRRGNGLVFSPRRELEPLDTGIDWHHMPKRLFGTGAINVQASVGCPFDCEFCNFVKDKKYTLIKPLDQLVRELKEVSDRGIEYVRFVDDNFRLGKNDLNQVCRRFIDEELGVKWMSFVRAGTLALTDLDKLRKAGCIEVQIGLESADENVLRNMNKHADTNMHHRVVTDLLNAGINCSCCFVVGFPGETRESVQRTIDFINSISGDSQEGVFSWSLYPFNVVPLSPIYEAEKKARYGLTGYMDQWEHRTMNSAEAHLYILEAFMQIESAGPIYSGDNMDMLLQLSPEDRKEFMKTRHGLSKVFLNEAVDRSRVIESFAALFG